MIFFFCLLQSHRHRFILLRNILAFHIREHLTFQFLFSLNIWDKKARNWGSERKKKKSREAKLIIAVSHEIQASHTMTLYIHIIPFDLWYFVNQYNLFLYITYFNQFLAQLFSSFFIYIHSFIVEIFRVEKRFWKIK